MTHSIVSVNPIPNNSVGGFEAVCACGFRMRNAFESQARRDGADHVDYMEKKADELRRAIDERMIADQMADAQVMADEGAWS